jgi:hypothetical protein
MDGPDFAAFSREVRERLRADMQSVRNPDGDVQPALYHYFAGSALKRIRLPWRAFDPERKFALADAIANATTLTQPDMIAFETTAWAVTVKARSDEERKQAQRGRVPVDIPTPSQHPDRIEGVQLLIFSVTEAEAWWSDITRDGRNPPSFGDWRSPIPEATPAEMGHEMTGRMLEPIRKAMWGR